MVDVGSVGKFQASFKSAVAVAIAALIAFVVETQMTQYVQTTLGYQQSFFLFYLVHSAFTFVFPLHCLWLIVATKHTVASLYDGLRTALFLHLEPRGSPSGRFPLKRFIFLMSFMLAGITLPGLLWFTAIPLAPVSDITAIWNANAFFAYIFTLHFLGVKWEPRKLGAVILATVGVLAVVYGGSQTEMPEDDPRPKSPSSPATAPFVGDVLTLIASILYGLYQVLYKKYATPSTSQSESIESHGSQYQAIAVRDAEGDTIEELAHRSESNEALPFGLFANFLTGAVGLSTIIVLGLFIPILNALAIEEFRLVPNMHTAASIAAICMGGMVFNAGFMILLGVWGPIVTSVGGLTTIVLMFISEAIFGDGLEALTIWSIMGSAVIVIAFGMLAHDMVRSR